ncbi:hypothetical protein LLEC1_05203, partial [Akanthomyces lecanii]
KPIARHSIKALQGKNTVKMKDSQEVIKDFNELVNMTASELETWLKSKDSGEAGWSKDDESGETVGHESGRKITEILKSNPNKDPKKYNDDQISHMRKVVAYCKRHLAQEEQSLKNKSESEAKKTKSYISLKNWGHDPLKKGGDNKKSSNESKSDDKEEAETKEEEADTEAGDKRKRKDKDAAPDSKKHRTRASSKDEKSSSEEEEEAAEETAGDDEAEENNKSKAKSKSKSESNSKNGPKPGDTVSWNWGNGQPKGKVLDVKEDKATITTKRGNKVSRDGDSEDPAVILDTGKSKAIKSAHELN